MKSILFLLAVAWGLLAHPAYSEMVMTVNGPIAPQDMGTTLPHEHLLVDFIGADSTGYHRWDKAEVIENVLPYLLEIKPYNVATFIDCTPAYLGRDPILLKRLSEQSGISILTPTGYYGARNNIFVPEHAYHDTVEELAARWIAEWENGIEATDVRPGFIKIGVDANETLTPIQEKIVRAACRTHLVTGLTIVSHTGPEHAVYDQLRVLKEEGVSPTAFVWTHAQHGSPEAHVEMAQKGVWISLDNTSADSARVEQRVAQLQNLKTHGLLDHVLISHDAGWYRPGEPDGGRFRGFTSLFTHLLPKLRAQGFQENEIEWMMVQNPQRAFAIRIQRQP